MSKKLSRKIKIVPEKPGKAIKKLEKNGFVLKSKTGSHFYYYRKKIEREYLVCVFVHSKELGKPAVKNIIRNSGKTNEEWVSL